MTRKRSKNHLIRTELYYRLIQMDILRVNSHVGGLEINMDRVKSHLPPSVKELFEAIKDRPFAEINQLMLLLEKEWGAKIELIPLREDSTPNTNRYDIYLTEVGPKKINVIKEVRAITGLGLKESKDLVESPLPKLLGLNIDEKQARQVKKNFEDINAVVSLI